MSKLKGISIEVYAEAGQRIETSVEMACHVAQTLNNPVMLNFNGARVFIDQMNSPDEIVPILMNLLCVSYQPAQPLTRLRADAP